MCVRACVCVCVCVHVCMLVCDTSDVAFHMINTLVKYNRHLSDAIVVIIIIV